MQEIRMTIYVNDEQKCQECFAPVNIDAETIEIYVGECPHCGTDIFLSPDENYEWETSQ